MRSLGVIRQSASSRASRSAVVRNEEFGEGLGLIVVSGRSVAVRARPVAGPRCACHAAAVLDGRLGAAVAGAAARNSTLPITPMAERLAPSSATQWR